MARVRAAKPWHVSSALRNIGRQSATVENIHVIHLRLGTAPTRIRPPCLQLAAVRCNIWNRERIRRLWRTSYALVPWLDISLWGITTSGRGDGWVGAPQAPL